MDDQQSNLNNYLKYLILEIVKVNTKVDCCANWLLEYTKKDKSLLELISGFPKCVVIPPPGRGEGGNGDDDAGADGANNSIPGVFDRPQVEVVDLEEDDSGSSYFEDEEPKERDCDEDDKASYSGSESELSGSKDTSDKKEIEPDSDEKKDIKPLVEIKDEPLDVKPTKVKKEADSADKSQGNNISEREETENEPKSEYSASAEIDPHPVVNLLALMKPCFVKLVKVNIAEHDDIQPRTSRHGTCSSKRNQRKKITTKSTNHKKKKCTICNKHFSSKHCRFRHHRVHTGEKPFGCSVCGKRFGLKGTLNSHFLVHTGEKPFGCSVCEKRFGLKSNLNAHFLVHTGEKPFRCRVCGKRFGVKGSLNTHFLVHTGEKRFRCSVCGKRFGLKGNLDKHFLVHTGEKRFRCHVCGKAFGQKASLERHILVHTGEKRFRCETCGKGFGQKISLTRHQKRNCN